jgi:hypothetical protein
MHWYAHNALSLGDSLSAEDPISDVHDRQCRHAKVLA